MSRVLVTGIGGFTGPYLRTALEGRGFHVTGVSSRTKAPADHPLDLLDAGALERFLQAHRFHYVVHLAAVSFAAHEHAADYYRVNVSGTANLLDALAHWQPQLKGIVLASSASVYGRPARVPIDESAVPAPLNHYGASKLAMELMARQWLGRLPILITRPFNYTGVGQSEKFVYAKIVSHFRQGAKQIELGDTSVVRELMDVRDVARVYADLLELDAAPGVVNLCSGVGYSLDEVLDRLRALTRMPLTVRRNEALDRRNDIPRLVGSPELLRRSVGHAAYRPLDETLRWMFAGA